jgi:hypothetical protein
MTLPGSCPDKWLFITVIAMVASTPKDISLIFGRYVPANNQQAEQTMAELHERHIFTKDAQM